MSFSLLQRFDDCIISCMISVLGYICAACTDKAIKQTSLLILICMAVLLCPQGKPIDFVDVDEGNRQWLAEFKSKPISMPHRLENMDGITEMYSYIIIMCIQGNENE